jgi:AbrB family looped-hinge helix DNA binding protein
MRINAKGQVTIPHALRKKTGLLPHTEVEFKLDGGAICIRRARHGKGPRRWPEWIEQMRGKGDGKMTTDEIMKLMRGE